VSTRRQRWTVAAWLGSATGSVARRAGGSITEFEQAEAIISTGDADMVALARASSMIRGGRGTPLPTLVRR